MCAEALKGMAEADKVPPGRSEYNRARFRISMEWK